MNPFIQIFQVREPFGPIYQIPALDKLTDTELEVPAKPVMTTICTGDAGWFSVANTTGYKLQRNLGGTGYETILTVDASDADEMLVHDSGIVKYGYYRVVAFNAAGDGPPSDPMDLNIYEQYGSGDSSCSDFSASAYVPPVESSSPSEDCVLFEGLVWDAPDISTYLTGTAEGTFVGNLVTAATSGDGAGDPATGRVFTTGNVYYTGPGQQCAVNVTDLVQSEFGSSFVVQVTVEGVGMVANVFVGGVTLFNLPECLTPTLISVYVNFQSGGFDIPADPTSVSAGIELVSCQP